MNSFDGYCNSNHKSPSVNKSDLITKCATILKQYPSRPALASAILSGEHVYSSKSKIPFSRSLLWKTSLLKIDTIRQPGEDCIPVFDLVPLREYRKNYKNVVTNIGIPWHLLPIDSKYYRSIKTSLAENLDEDLSNLSISNSPNLKRKLKREELNASSNPISRNTTLQESDLGFLTVIIADVERLFPEYPEMFINNKSNKISMIELLYRYAKWNNKKRHDQGKKELGYVQGMHELCAVIFAVLNVELIDETMNNKDIVIDKFSSQIMEFFSRDFLWSDLFAMFDKLMEPIADKYFTSSGILRESIVFDLKLHHLDIGSTNQPGLAAVLKGEHIESQLWLTRWFRMILTREVGLAYSVRIWDGLIAYGCVGASSDTVTGGNDISVLLPSVILLLVLRIRSQILIASVPTLKAVFGTDIDDSIEALSFLLHYPIDKNSSFSRSVSPSVSFECDPEEQIMMHRRNISNDIQTQKLIDKATALPKMPSALDLLHDAVLICGLSDDELSQLGPKLIKKYSNGDIYEIYDNIRRNKRTTKNIFAAVLQKSQSWTSPHTTSVDSNLKTDAYRTRMENRLQKKVKDKLNE